MGAVDGRGASGTRRALAVGARYGASGLAVLLLWTALVVPDRPAGLTAGSLLRVPVEGAVLAALVLLVPARARGWTAGLAGALIGVSTVLRAADIGYLKTVDRPFDPLADWATLGPAIGVLGDSAGRPVAVAAAVLLVVLVVGLPLVVGAAAVRVARLAARHRRRTVHAVAGLGLACAVGVASGAAGGPPLASARAAGALSSEAARVSAGLQEREALARRLAVPDPVDRPPAGELLAGLSGKDVLLVFVESYGRVAVEDPDVSAGITADLVAGTGALRAAGYSARSAFLTSPTVGGYSWLAHATLQSGLWIDDQLTYEQLQAADRSTLTSLFGRAGWRTAVAIPSSASPWPEGQRFYRYDVMYGTGDLGYAGPAFSYAKVPDQFTLEALRRRELGPGPRRPVMAEVDLVSSHSPWAPLPRPVPWADLGDGAVFGPMPAQGQDPTSVWGDPQRVRAAYADSIRYSLGALLSFVREYGDDDLVVVLVGDHQPSSAVTGEGAGRDVPVSVIARDPRVLDRIAPWRWHEGLLPGPGAPVWPMDAFRDRFVAAYTGT